MSSRTVVLWAYKPFSALFFRRHLLLHPRSVIGIFDIIVMLVAAGRDQLAHKRSFYEHTNPFCLFFWPVPSPSCVRCWHLRHCHCHRLRQRRHAGNRWRDLVSSQVLVLRSVRTSFFLFFCLCPPLRTFIVGILDTVIVFDTAIVFDSIVMLVVTGGIPLARKRSFYIAYKPLCSSFFRRCVLLHLFIVAILDVAVIGC